MSPEPFVGVEEVAAYLGGVPVGTIYDWIYRGIGPPSYKIGRHRRFRLGEVAGWVEAQRQATNDERQGGNPGVRSRLHAVPLTAKQRGSSAR